MTTGTDTIWPDPVCDSTFTLTFVSSGTTVSLPLSESPKTTVSPEMTFIPAKRPHEIVDVKAGQKLVNRINDWLKTDPITYTLWAKLDPHHNEHSYDTKPVTYTVEIVPYRHWWTHWFEDATDEKGKPDGWAVLGPALHRLFDGLRDRFGLIPSLRTKRAGVERHWPGGGCHIHYGIADLFQPSFKWYTLMECFHHNLLVDFANRPWIRWLFKQWFADGCKIPVDGDDLTVGHDGQQGPLPREPIISRSITGGNGIEPRFMPSSKGVYPTFEFRMFSMVDTPEELRLIVRFLDRWVRSLRDRTIYRRILPEADYLAQQAVQPDLTLERFRAMCDERTAWGFCEAFLVQLGLTPADYRPFYDRHYLNRIRHGKMV